MGRVITTVLFLILRWATICLRRLRLFFFPALLWGIGALGNGESMEKSVSDCILEGRRGCELNPHGAYII